MIIGRVQVSPHLNVHRQISELFHSTERFADTLNSGVKFFRRIERKAKATFDTVAKLLKNFLR